MNDLDARLRTADPAATLGPDAAQGSVTLAARAAAVTAPAAPAPTSWWRRRPVVTVLVAGGIALAGTAAAAVTVLDLFSPNSDIAVTVEFEVPAGAQGGASCTSYLNLVRADGQSYSDNDGFTTSGGSAESFDQADFDATVAYIRERDWTDLVAPTLSGTTSLTGDGEIALEGELGGVAEIVEAELAANGLNSTGSAILVETGSCQVGYDS